MPVAQSPAHYINSSEVCPSITESFPLVVFFSTVHHRRGIASGATPLVSFSLHIRLFLHWRLHAVEVVLGNPGYNRRREGKTCHTIRSQERRGGEEEDQISPSPPPTILFLYETFSFLSNLHTLNLYVASFCTCATL
jgi:hypothetical protein